MAYSRKLIFKWPKSIGEVLKKFKFWKSLNQKNIYLLQKMQTIVNVKTLNSRK